MIRVLIVDDSPTVLEFLSRVLGEDSSIKVIGAVKDGPGALEFLERERPDVVTMDIDMPGMNGFEVTRRIMETNPVPIVIVSGLSVSEQHASFQAFEAGALAVVSRPPAAGHERFEEEARELRNAVKAMAEVKVVRRWARQRDSVGEELPGPPAHVVQGIVGIGASTGGPGVLKDILTKLPPDFAFPVVLVQHMTRGFLQGFAEWLGSVTALNVMLAQGGAHVQPGCVYVAPEDYQMGVGGDGRIVLGKPRDPGSGGLCPSVSWLFHSLADSYGPSATGVLLTGMGRDGADGLKLMRDRGAITIAQSAETCIVNGMPAAAVSLGAATYVLSPLRIGEMLTKLASRKSSNDSPEQWR